MLPRELYDMMPFILGGLLAALGMFMFLCPKINTKKEYRDNPEMVAKTKKSGIIEIVCGILLIVIELVL